MRPRLTWLSGRSGNCANWTPARKPPWPGSGASSGDPSASSAALSAANVRNPTFTPDVADLYVFRLEATNAAGAICIRTLAFTAVPPPPTILLNDGSFGVRSNRFGFNVSAGAGQVVVVETSTNLVNWTGVATITLTNRSAYFSDPQWANYPARFYRLRSP